MAHAEPTTPHAGHHIIPKQTLYKVFGALVGLTVLTGLTAQLELGALNIPLALAIAGTKAALVVLFFMGLKYDSPVNRLVLIVGSIFVVVFLTFTLFDTAFRGDLGNVDARTIMDRQRAEEALRAREPGPAGTQAGAPADSLLENLGPGEGVQQEAAESMGAVDSSVQDVQEAVGAETEEEEQQP